MSDTTPEVPSGQTRIIPAELRGRMHCAMVERAMRVSGNSVEAEQNAEAVWKEYLRIEPNAAPVPPDMWLLGKVIERATQPVAIRVGPRMIAIARATTKCRDTDEAVSVSHKAWEEYLDALQAESCRWYYPTSPSELARWTVPSRRAGEVRTWHVPPDEDLANRSRGRAIDWVKRRSRTPTVAVTDLIPRQGCDASDGAGFSLENTAIDQASSPEEKKMASEHKELIRSCLETLPPREREVLRLRHLGENVANIAEMLGVSTGTVSCAYRRGLQLFVERLQARGITLDDFLLAGGMTDDE